MVSKGKRAKPLVGRPPLAAADRRDTLVRVLTTKSEHAELQKAANRAGLSVSSWVRVAVLEAARRSSGGSGG